MAESFGDSLPSARTGPHPGIEFRIRRAPKEATMPWIRSLLWLIALLLAVICAPARAQSASTGPEQAYPAKPVTWIVRFASTVHASNSERAMRTSPQAVYSQSEWASSSIVQ